MCEVSVKNLLTILTISLLSGCATTNRYAEWTSTYGKDFCAPAYGAWFGVPTGVMAGLAFANPIVGVGTVLAGTVIYGSVGGNEFAYGSKETKQGMSLTNCARSFKKNLIEGNEPAQSDTSEADR